MEAVVVDRAVLRVSGKDAETFLQGQLSQDVTKAPGLAFLLEPTGKVTALLRFSRSSDGSFLLDTDTAAGEAVETRLRRFMLRVDVLIEPRPEWRAVRIFGGPRLPQAQVISVWPTPPYPQEILTSDPEREASMIGAEWLDAIEADRRRIAAGVPVSGVDIGPDTIPGEVGAALLDAAVSFTKGCYTGQELVARIDSRGGNVPRLLRAIRAPGRVLEAGAEISVDGKRVGQITSAAGDIALGRVARSVDPPARVTVLGADATVEALPVAL